MPQIRDITHIERRLMKAEGWAVQEVEEIRLACLAVLHAEKVQAVVADLNGMSGGYAPEETIGVYLTRQLPELMRHSQLDHQFSLKLTIALLKKLGLNNAIIEHALSHPSRTRFTLRDFFVRTRRMATERELAALPYERWSLTRLLARKAQLIAQLGDGFDPDMSADLATIKKELQRRDSAKC